MDSTRICGQLSRAFWLMLLIICPAASRERARARSNLQAIFRTSLVHGSVPGTPLFHRNLNRH